MGTNCETVREVLEEFREGRLDRSEQTAVEQHLRYCEDCILRWTLLRVDAPENLVQV